MAAPTQAFFVRYFTDQVLHDFALAAIKLENTCSNGLANK